MRDTGPAGAETGEGEPAPDRARRGPFPLWLASTLLLALACLVVGWLAYQRVPETIERVVQGVPAPVPAELAARAAQLERLGASLAARLAGELDRVTEPPVCRPDQQLDAELFRGLLERETEELAALRRVQAGERAAAPAGRAIAIPAALPVAPTAGPALSDARDRDGPTPAPPSGPSVADGARLDPRSSGALSDLLEASSAMVLGPGQGAAGGLSTGTAFFVAPELMVTNRHVVETADPARLFVASRRLGGLRPVELVAISPPGDQTVPDFAVLRLLDGRAPAVLPLAASGGKLTPVVVAGYPGLGLRTDAGFLRLLEGDLGAAPDLNMNRGEVRSVQPVGEVTRLVHTADVLKGYSGGPLIDSCGRAIGVNTFIQVDQAQASKLNHAISTADLVDFLALHGIRLPTDERACPSG